MVVSGFDPRVMTEKGKDGCCGWWLAEVTAEVEGKMGVFVAVVRGVTAEEGFWFGSEVNGGVGCDGDCNTLINPYYA